LVRRWLPLLAVAALLTAAFVASALADPQFEIRVAPAAEESVPPPGGASAPAAEPTPTESAAAEPFAKPPLIPGWLEMVAWTICVLVLIVLGVFLAWYVLRDTIQARGRPLTVDRAPPSPASHVAEVAAALSAGLDELARGSDPRSVVIACWVRLEQAAGEAGTPRRASDAPADYVLRLLAGHQVSRTVLDRLAGVYRQARYSSGPVDESMRREAVAALEHLRAELSASGASGTSGPGGPGGAVGAGSRSETP
jgi:hypothetical protein